MAMQSSRKAKMSIRPVGTGRSVLTRQPSSLRRPAIRFRKSCSLFSYHLTSIINLYHNNGDMSTKRRYIFIGGMLPYVTLGVWLDCESRSYLANASAHYIGLL